MGAHHGQYLIISQESVEFGLADGVVVDLLGFVSPETSWLSHEVTATVDSKTKTPSDDATDQKINVQGPEVLRRLPRQKKGEGKTPPPYSLVTGVASGLGY